ncbi:MAG: hypothetical protein PHY13_05775 [Clostridia bacterium]|nr:hypothetical protein [Clostridia bacterium]
MHRLDAKNSYETPEKNVAQDNADDGPVKISAVGKPTNFAV